MTGSDIRRIFLACLFLCAAGARAQTPEPTPIQEDGLFRNLAAAGVLAAPVLGGTRWARYDTDKNGRVTKPEFLNGRRQERDALKAEKDHEKAWLLSDWDNDGMLRDLELENGFWLKYDENKSSSVTRDEFLQGRVRELGGTLPEKKTKFAKDELVNVLWGAKWWKSTVLDIKDKQYLIHYEGWDSNWDEWVPESRIQALERATDKDPRWKKDDRVEVESNGTWHSATIVDVKNDWYKITYDQQAGNRDEWVNHRRMRSIGGAPKQE